MLRISGGHQLGIKKFRSNRYNTGNMVKSFNIANFRTIILFERANTLTNEEIQNIRKKLKMKII